MGFDHRLEQKRLSFSRQPSGYEYNENRTGAGGDEKLDRLTYNVSGKNDHVIGISVNNLGTNIMGEPAKPSSNPENKMGAAWASPQLMPDLTFNIQREQDRGLHLEYDPHEDRKLNVNASPIEACPYVLDDTTPPSTPSGKSCRSPFVPSFKDVTKFLTFPSFLWARIDAFIERLNRWSKNADSLAEHFWAHMKLGGNVSETVWGKLSLGAKIVSEGGLENLFKLSFSVGPREKLLKTSACYLSTTTGPVAGLLFISTEKLAFCSDRPLSFTSPNGGLAWSYYRVVIPLGRLKSVNPCESVNKPSEKYIQIQTVDDHEFWFMGFVSYRKAFKHLQQAVSSR